MEMFGREQLTRETKPPYIELPMKPHYEFPQIETWQKKEADQIFRDVFSYPFEELVRHYKSELMTAGEDESRKEAVEEKSCDDNGKVYMENGHLLPNNTYELNGNIYETDDQGRIIRCEAKPKRSPENPRDIEAQKEAGGEDRQPGDQGGHIVSRDLNGDSGPGNLIAMDSRINQSDYKRMENDIRNALEEGKEVTTKTEVSYSGDSERPDKITVTVIVDGKKTVYTFDNNLDGSLMEKVADTGSESDVKNVKEVLEETKGQISSIKEEYDDQGNLIKTTVNITYTGEDGKNYRRTVTINHTVGGEQ